jgi:hypothetical protein
LGARIRGVAIVAAVLGVGAFIGSSVPDWWDRGGIAGGGGAPAWDGKRVRVEVLNGGGRSGMAREATDRLRSHGFDVVYWGNASSFGRENSVVLDRVGNPETATSVAEALGITGVRTEPDSSLLLDVSVVLGQDWEPVSTDVVPPEPRWWDVRRLFQRDVEEPVGPIADPPVDDDGRD